MALVHRYHLFQARFATSEPMPTPRCVIPLVRTARSDQVADTLGAMRNPGPAEALTMDLAFRRTRCGPREAHAERREVDGQRKHRRSDRGRAAHKALRRPGSPASP